MISFLLLFLLENSPDQRRLEIMIGDFMKTTLPYFDVCISNTPYQVRESIWRQNGV